MYGDNSILPLERGVIPGCRGVPMDVFCALYAGHTLTMDVAGLNGTNREEIVATTIFLSFFLDEFSQFLWNV